MLLVLKAGKLLNFVLVVLSKTERSYGMCMKRNL